MSLTNRDYKKGEVVGAGLVDKITEGTCTAACHNDKSPFVGEAYVFDFEERIKLGIHEISPLKYKH
jgi:hypothetical protein